MSAMRSKIERQESTLRAYATWNKKLSPDNDEDAPSPRSVPGPAILALAPNNLAPQYPSPKAARTSAAMRASMALPAEELSNIELQQLNPDVQGNLASSDSRVVGSPSTADQSTTLPSRTQTKNPPPPLTKREDTTLRAFDVWKQKLSPEQDQRPVEGKASPEIQIQVGLLPSSTSAESKTPAAESSRTARVHEHLFAPEKQRGWKRVLFQGLTYALVVNGTMSKWAHFLSRKNLETKIAPGWRGWLRYIFFWVLGFLDASLRGASQCVLANNPIAGLIVCIASLQYSRWHFVLTMTGLVMSTLTAVVLGVNRAPIRNGLFGYSGFLIGAAAALMVDDIWNYQIFLCVAFLGALCAILNVTLGNWLVPKYRLPPLTTSFVICAMTLLACVQHSTNIAVLSIGAPALPPASRFDPQVHINGTVVYNAWIRGVGQMILLPDKLSGWLLLAAMLFYSRISTSAAAMGSLLGCLLCIYLGLDGTEAISAGLWGFVPALTGIALCGLFFALTPTTVLLSILGILFSVLLSVPMRMAGGVIGLPVFSFPFIATTWLFLGAQGSIKHAPAVDLTEISTPERHLMDLWRAEKERKERQQMA